MTAALPRAPENPKRLVGAVAVASVSAARAMAYEADTMVF